MSAEVLRLTLERRFADAFQLAASLAESKPLSIVTLLLAGEAALRVRNNSEANEYAMRVLAIEARSRDGLLLSATAFRCSGEFAEAERLLTVASRDYGFSGQLEGRRLQELGLLNLETGRIDQSLKLLERALRLRPTDVQLLCELGHVREQLGQVDASREVFERAYRLDPSYFLAIRNMASSALNAGDPESALKWANEAIAIEPHDEQLAAVWLLAATSAMSVDAQTLRDCHLKYAQCAEPVKVVSHAALVRPVEHDHTRQLKIGYFSHHFHQFPLASFLPHVLAAHDRSRFRVYALSMGGKVDHVTKSYVACVDEFHDLSTMSNLEAANRIRSLGIDIVIDMSGYTTENHFAVLRYRPAALQMSWLGYLASAGSAAIDYHITDSQANPPTLCDSLFVEKLIRLPSQYSYKPMVETPEPAESRHQLNGYVTFGFFSAPTKLNAESLQTFASILNANPASRMQFYAGSERLKQRVLEVFARAGVKRHRVVFLGKQSLQEYFGALSKIDILLDSFPFVGGTTVCDALWMGVPTVSMFLPRGFGGAARSVLHAVGHPELVAKSIDEYIEIACGLAKNPDRLSDLQKRLRNTMRSSALMDAGATTRALEQAYQLAWDAFCRGAPPEPIAVA